MEDIQKKLLATFKIEASEYLEQMTAWASKARKQNLAPPHPMDELHRWAHSLKGAARAVDKKEIVSLAFNLETLFLKIKEKNIKISIEAVNFIEESITLIESRLKISQESSCPPIYPELTEKFESLLNPEKQEEPSDNYKTQQQPPSKTPEEKLKQKLLDIFYTESGEHLEKIRLITDTLETAFNKELLEEAMREAHSLKGAARVVELEGVQILAHKMETLFTEILQNENSFNRKTSKIILIVVNAIEDYLFDYKSRATASISEKVYTQINSFLEQPTSGEKKIPHPEYHHKRKITKEKKTQYIKVNADGVQALEKSIGHFLSEGIQNQWILKHIKNAQKNLNLLEYEWFNINGIINRAAQKYANMPDFQKITEYINYVNHYVKKITRQINKVGQLNKKNSYNMLNLGNELQKSIHLTRMLPAGDILLAYRKMIRDLAADENKIVEFKLKGMDHLVDRHILQELKDSVIHLLRNAVSHGIETQEERINKNKPATGKIILDVKVSGSQITLCFKDDGKGMDLEKIRQQAIEKGLIDSTAKLSGEDVLDLIFAPGFSTSNYITNISGRGMGLSVVKETLNRLQGDYQIITETDKGTEIYLTLPISITSQKILLIKEDNLYFGIPITHVKRLFIVNQDKIDFIENKPFVYLEKIPYALMSLKHLLYNNKDFTYDPNKKMNIILIKVNQKKYALRVDKFIREMEVIVKPLPSPIENLLTFSGGFMNPEGAPSLILSPAELFNPKSTERLHANFINPLDYDQQEKQSAKILIVDDSITTRTLEKTILEGNGYDVYVSFNGEEALQVLRKENIDLVITDVNMPKMDGFSLVKEMKKSPNFKKIPIIIVSSMESKEHREQGLNLGADAYIVKQTFEQKELLYTIRQIL